MSDHIGPWYHDTMGPWVHGTMVPWHHGTMAPWYHGTMVPWHHATMGPWYHGTMLPGCGCSAAELLAMDSWLWAPGCAGCGFLAVRLLAVESRIVAVDSWIPTAAGARPPVAAGGVGRPRSRDPRNYEPNPPEPLHRKLCLGKIGT